MNFLPSIAVDVRKFVGSNSYNIPILIMKKLHLKMKGPLKSLNEIPEPRRSAVPWSGKLMQGMEKKIISDRYYESRNLSAVSSSVK